MPRTCRRPWCGSPASMISRTLSGSACADDMIGLRREAGPATSRSRCEEVQRFGVTVDEDRSMLADLSTKCSILSASISNAGTKRRRMSTASSRSRSTCSLRHADRLVPQAGLAVAEAPTGPLQSRAASSRTASRAGGDRHSGERLAGRAARGDLEHLPLAVVVGEQAEVQVPANVVLREHRKPADVVERRVMSGDGRPRPASLSR